MMKLSNTKSFREEGKLCLALMILAVNVLAVHAASPEIADVSIGQSGSKLVINYKLKNAPAIVTFDLYKDATEESDGVRIDPALLDNASGDCHALIQPDASQNRRIVWQYVKKGLEPGNLQKLKARVTAWATNAPPWYMSVDIRPATPAAARRRYYASADDVPGGVTNDQYKITHLLMRRIPAAGVEWVMGKEDRPELHLRHAVVLTRDYYIAVYEATRGQWATLKGNALPENPKYPVNQSYDALFGQNSPYPDSLDVPSGVGMTAWRNGTGIMSLTLPTDAQWEYASRAGRASRCPWGPDNLKTPDNTYDPVVMTYDPVVMTNYANWGTESLEDVGRRLPNAFGLYDTLGNTSEWVRDWQSEGDNYFETFQEQMLAGMPVVDPIGVSKDKASKASNVAARTTRGGHYHSYWTYIDCAFRNWYPPNSAGADWGYRLCCAVPGL